MLLESKVVRLLALHPRIVRLPQKQLEDIEQWSSLCQAVQGLGVRTEQTRQADMISCHRDRAL